MGSHWTRIVVPAVGLLAVTTALALVAIAPVVLFPSSAGKNGLPPAPDASREVARVTAPPLRSSGGEAPVAASAAPAPATSAIPGVSLAANSAAGSGVAAGEAGTPTSGPSFRTGAAAGSPTCGVPEEPS